MSSGKKVLGYTPGPAVGSSYNTKPDSTLEADWKKVLNKRKSDRRTVKRRENRASYNTKPDSTSDPGLRLPQLPGGLATARLARRSP